jgi:hypothetical protein
VQPEVDVAGTAYRLLEKAVEDGTRQPRVRILEGCGAESRAGQEHLRRHTPRGRGFDDQAGLRNGGRRCLEHVPMFVC